jgi:hypothetical protein
LFTQNLNISRNLPKEKKTKQTLYSGKRKPKKKIPLNRDQTNFFSRKFTLLHHFFSEKNVAK